MKKIKLIVATLLIIYLMTNITWASNENIKLLINYGAKTTNANLVTLSFSSDDLDRYKDYDVEFSLDQKTWFSYDFTESRWEKDYKVKFQEFYPNFNLGIQAGKKTVFVKLKNGSNILNLSASIKYDITNQNNPNLVKNTNMKELTSRGLGTLEDPYITKSQNVKLNVNFGLSTYVKYMTDGAWSEWKALKNGEADFNIKLKDSSGLNTVYYITKSSNGIQSSAKSICYFIDKDPPKIKITSEYYGVIAVDGKTKFQVGVYDNSSKNVSYTIDIKFYGKSKVIEGVSQILEPEKYIFNEYSLDGLPKGTFLITVTAKDEVGNKAVREQKIYSY